MKNLLFLIIILGSIVAKVNAQMAGDDFGRYTDELKNYISELKQNRVINSALADSAQMKHVITYGWFFVIQDVISDNYDGIANLWDDTKVYTYSGNEKYRVLSFATAELYSGTGAVNSALIISNRNLAHIVTYVCDYSLNRGVLLVWTITSGEIKYSKYFFDNLEKISSTNNELWYQLSSYDFNIIAANGDILRIVKIPIDPSTFIFERFEHRWHD